MHLFKFYNSIALLKELKIETITFWNLFGHPASRCLVRIRSCRVHRVTWSGFPDFHGNQFNLCRCTRSNTILSILLQARCLQNVNKRILGNEHVNIKVLVLWKMQWTCAVKKFSSYPRASILPLCIEQDLFSISCFYQLWQKLNWPIVFTFVTC